MDDRGVVRRLIRVAWATASVVFGVTLLAACTGGGTPGATGTHAASHTASHDATATVTPTPAASAPQTATARPTPTMSTAPVAGPARCSVAGLKGAVGERNGAPAGSGDGMNQEQVAIILTNTGRATCTLQGWPGVSLVGDGNGTQLGAAASLDRTAAHPTLSIAPGGKVQAPIDYSNAAVYAPSECHEKAADGLRVYPPGSTASLFIAEKWEACTTSQHDLLKVGAFVPYP